MSSGSETRQRQTAFKVRLSVAERATLEAAAVRSGLTLGSYIRQVALGSDTPRQVRRPPVERAELARLLGQLGRLGGNLNQIARRVNAGGSVSADIFTAMHSDLVILRDAALHALGRHS